MLDNIEFIIPCGGKSTRNYPHSKGLPHKSLLPFGSMRLIDYVLKEIFDMGGRHITIVCSSQKVIDDFKEALKPCPEIEAKLRASGRTHIADALKATEIPQDADIKYVIQSKPLGTSHVLGLAHRISKNRHAVMYFPDDLYINKDPKNTHLKKLVNAFLKNEKQILITGMYRDDVSNNAIIENGRLIEKPKNPTNHIGGISPMVIPKPVLDYMTEKVEPLENGTFKPSLIGNEWVYTDGINGFLDERGEKNPHELRMFLKDDDDAFMDTGTLPLYEHAMLLALLTMSVFKDEHIAFAKALLNKPE